ncbi:unnamed protein product [Amoebophrya sp. A120]|nr:unnamed protein product [Amoebophrya sp. A120]|eukprot:GSA120T00011812001.1
MGVLSKSGAWVSSKGLEASVAMKEGVVSELERCQKAIASLLKVMPSFPCDAVASACASVKAILDKIQEIEAVAWSKEKLYGLYILLIGSIESIIGSISPFVVQPMLWVKDQLIGVCMTLTTFCYTVFGKIDDSLVTPIVMAGTNTGVCLYTTAKDITYTQYAMVKDGLVMPVVSTVNAAVVSPAYSAASCVAKGATSKAINVSAWVDSKLSLVSMMAAVVEKSKKLDECVTSGAIEKKLVRPALATATSLDSKYLGGSTQDLISSTVVQFQEAKGVPVVPAVTVKPVANKTAAGAPTISRPQVVRQH